MNPNPKQSRRSFLKKTTAVTAAVSTLKFFKTPVYGQSQAPSANVAGANNRIAVAYIGTGSQGMAHVNSQKKNAAENNLVQAAVCDLYQKRLDEAKKVTGVDDAGAFR